MKVPQHVAIILDGNGRWAKAKGMPRNYGHAQGSKNVERICEEAWRMGIKYLTVYAFSTENWNRPKDEVDALMKLLRNYMKTCLKTAAKNDMKVRVIGDIEPLDEDIKKRISELEAATVDNGGMRIKLRLMPHEPKSTLSWVRRRRRESVLFTGKMQFAARKCRILFPVQTLSLRKIRQYRCIRFFYHAPTSKTGYGKFHGTGNGTLYGKTAEKTGPVRPPIN